MKLALSVNRNRLTVSVSDCHNATVVVKAVSARNGRTRYTPQSVRTVLFNSKTEGYETQLSRSSERYSYDVSVAVLTVKAAALWRVTVIEGGNAYGYLLTDGADFTLDSNTRYGATADSFENRLALEFSGYALAEGTINARNKSFKQLACEVVEAETANVSKFCNTIRFGVYRKGKILADTVKKGTAIWEITLPEVKAAIPKGCYVEF